MSVGDVNSSERGSGARFNDDKVDLTLLPPASWEVMADEVLRLDSDYCHDASYSPYVEEVSALAAFWEGDTGKILEILDSLSPYEYQGAARVFAHGAIKYAKWNWAKGMPWSVPMACYLRHMLTADPESEDGESGMLHRHHAVCNLIMLGHYAVLCPDMDDRPLEIRAEFHRPNSRATAEELGVDEFEDVIILDDLVGHADQHRNVEDYIQRLNRGWGNLLDLPTSDLNNLVEELVEEQESRERILRSTGCLRSTY